MLSQLALKATIADLELVRKELGRKSEKGHTHDCNRARQRSECYIYVHMYTIYMYAYKVYDPIYGYRVDIGAIEISYVHICTYCHTYYHYNSLSISHYIIHRFMTSTGHNMTQLGRKSFPESTKALSQLTDQ